MQIHVSKLWDNKASRWDVSHVYKTMAFMLCEYISFHVEVI